MSACASNAFARASSLCSSAREEGAPLAEADRSGTAATFGTKCDAASRAADGASGRGNSETDDYCEMEAAALSGISPGEISLASLVLEEDSAIRPCELPTCASRGGTA